MADALTAADVVELAVVERSGLIESRHQGAAVVLDPTGVPIVSLGNPGALVFPRSTLKPMQAVAMLEQGLDLDGEELVLAAASHPATTLHVAVVRRILERAGLSPADLTCPAEWPGDAEARHHAVRPERITMNCSGKHAAFLLTSVTRGWPLDSVLDRAHPLQQAIHGTVERLTGEAVTHWGTDGCGAPLPAVTLTGLARAIGFLARGAEPAGARLAAAVRANPWALDLPAVATVMSRTALIAKRGAEGVFVAATPDGTAVALKILDGSVRPALAVALSLLARVGAVDAAVAADLAERTAEPVLGGGAVVGALRSVV